MFRYHKQIFSHIQVFSRVLSSEEAVGFTSCTKVVGGLYSCRTWRGTWCPGRRGTGGQWGTCSSLP